MVVGTFFYQRLSDILNGQEVIVFIEDPFIQKVFQRVVS
jgi:hypothetical protein